ncbi:THAP domain-containing protein 2-like [Camponotus floridanus]|uniref:THAP domain-containing protein 2-like n=1 Tax=Camponotus floridanus TaxID=104421 RepID=UPI00097163D8|nr:THAP domain-containing protein 2-like [Camponotus floridanus]
MPTRCIAVGCKNTASPSGKTATQMKFEKVMKITFHSFPSDPIRRAEWIRIMKLEDKIITNRSRLCSLHFKEKYIDRTSLVYVRLRENAVPHIFEDSLDCDNIDTAMKNERTILPAQSVKTTILTEPLKPMKQGDNLEQNSVIHSVCDKETNTAPFLLQEIRTSTEDKETRISPERIRNMNLSDIKVIRQERCTEIKSLRKQIQALQKKVWQKHKKIAIMKTILNELKIENIISD